MWTEPQFIRILPVLCIFISLTLNASQKILPSCRKRLPSCRILALYNWLQHYCMMGVAETTADACSHLEANSNDLECICGLWSSCSVLQKNLKTNTFNLLLHLGPSWAAEETSWEPSRTETRCSISPLRRSSNGGKKNASGTNAYKRTASDTQSSAETRMHAHTHTYTLKQISSWHACSIIKRRPLRSGCCCPRHTTLPSFMRHGLLLHIHTYTLYILYCAQMTQLSSGSWMLTD